MANTVGVALSSAAGLCFQLFDAVAGDAGAVQRQPAADGQAGVVLQGLQQGLQHGQVAVGRFNEQLGLPGFQRQRFQFADALSALLRVLRQVADKGKVLSVEPAGGQCQQQATPGRPVARR